MVVGIILIRGYARLDLVYHYKERAMEYSNENERTALIQSLSSWYDENEEKLDKEAAIWRKETLDLQERFLEEWPLSRLENMSVDEYVSGKGRESQSLCYELEHGKYKHLFLSIGGGTAAKFGLYYSKTKGGYYDSSHNLVTEEVLPTFFSQLKEDLLEIVRVCLAREFDSPVLMAETSTNMFRSKTALVTKLICAYDLEHQFIGMNIARSQGRLFWDTLVPPTEYHSYYEQNYLAGQVLTKHFPKWNAFNASIWLWLFHEDKNHKKEQSSDMVMEKEGDYHHISIYTDKVLQAKNVIFRGAPGTGKTYLAKNIAAEIVSEGAVTHYDKLNAEQKKQVGFVQFHPSYDYTDFIEGLRPVTIKGQMAFELQKGVFKKFVEGAIKNQQQANKSQQEIKNERLSENKINSFLENIALDTYQLVTINGTVFYITEFDEDSIFIHIPDNKVSNVLKLDRKVLEELVTSNHSFSQVKDITTYFGKKNATQQYSYYLALLKEINNLEVSISSEEKQVEEEKKYVFIIDEINRGEISKIFGELFYSIDPGYRGKAGAIATQYANLHDELEGLFYIPDNVYIIGTMNDIDRSVDSFDFAMRRRFRFIEIKAEDQMAMLAGLNNYQEAIQRLNELNQAISRIDGLNTHYHIGPSYFLQYDDVGPHVLWEESLKPLLEDYVRGLYNEEQIMTDLEKAYKFIEDSTDDA